MTKDEQLVLTTYLKCDIVKEKGYDIGEWLTDVFEATGLTSARFEKAIASLEADNLITIGRGENSRTLLSDQVAWIAITWKGSQELGLKKYYE